jgi:hypothetical protein
MQLITLITYEVNIIQDFSYRRKEKKIEHGKMHRNGRTCLFRSFVSAQGHEIVFDKKTRGSFLFIL